MPAAVYDNKFTGERIGPRKFPTPKRIEDPNAWLRAIKKVIPEVPDATRGEDGWMMLDWITDTQILLFPLVKGDGEKANIAVDRKVEMIG